MARQREPWSLLDWLIAGMAVGYVLAGVILAYVWVP